MGPAGQGSRDRPGRTGRPPRINRAMIAEAASSIGTEGLTLRAVADHLGVSVAALYHHVEGKDDLLRLAAEYSAGQIPLPVESGQHWALWLSEWGRYTLEAFASEPALISRYMEGAVSAEAVAGGLDRALGGLAARGFGPDAARRAYDLVTTYAIGAAVVAVRDGRACHVGRSEFAGRIGPIIDGIALARGEDPEMVRTRLREGLDRPEGLI